MNTKKLLTYETKFQKLACELIEFEYKVRMHSFHDVYKIFYKYDFDQIFIGDFRSLKQFLVILLAKLKGKKIFICDDGLGNYVFDKFGLSFNTLRSGSNSFIKCLFYLPFMSMIQRLPRLSRYQEWTASYKENIYSHNFSIARKRHDISNQSRTCCYILQDLRLLGDEQKILEFITNHAAHSKKIYSETFISSHPKRCYTIDGLVDIGPIQSSSKSIDAFFTVCSTVVIDMHFKGHFVEILDLPHSYFSYPNLTQKAQLTISDIISFYE